MPEAFGYHREKYAKSYTMGTRKLLPAQRQFQEYLFDRLPQPIYTERAAILRHPAFQAGCRGFEPRLPLHAVNRLCVSASGASWWQPNGEGESERRFCYTQKGVQRHSASSCARHSASAFSHHIVAPIKQETCLLTACSERMGCGHSSAE